MTSLKKIKLAAPLVIAAIIPLVAQAAGIESLKFLGNISVPELIGRVIRGFLGLTGTLSLAMFVYGGFIWMTAQGNDDKIKKAKNTIVWATLGIFAVFSAYAGVEYIFTFLG